MIEPTQLQVPAAKGLNTWAARGSTDQPFELRGAVLRPGGWACAPASQERVPGAGAALWAGQGSSLFVNTPTGIQLWTGQFLAPLDGRDLGQTLRDGVTLAPGLAFVDDLGEWLYLTANQGGESAGNSAHFQRSLSTPRPAGPWYDQTGNDTSLKPGVPVKVRLVPIIGPDAPAPSPYRWATELTITPEEGQTNLTLGNLTWPVNIYLDGKFVRSNVLRDGGLKTEVAVLPDSSTMPEVPTELFLIKPRAADYHQGRVWLTGETKLYRPTEADPVLYEGRRPTRLYYSEVTATITRESLPQFFTDYWVDVPFRASVEIVAVQSAGRYLYIFGDREVWVLNGYDDQSWTLELLGDSIGVISPASVQRIQNAVLYLSDSGLLLLSGGQAQDVGGDVRDLLLNLNRTTLSSTVDHVQEQYLISDGVTTLVYHLREQGWTQRDPDGPGQRLLYGGGTPYSLHSGGLHTLDSPDLLPLTVSVGPFGSARQRRQWRGVAAVVDSDAGGTLSARLTGRDVTMGQQATDTVTGEGMQRAGPGVTPAALSLGRDGVTVTATLGTLTLTLTPAPGARRCLLRPPLDVIGAPQGETWAQ